MLIEEMIQDNPGTPVVLHTLPSSSSSTSSSLSPSSSSSSTNAPKQDNGKAKPQPKSKCPLPSCLLTAPRLISVVELIKREYVSELRAAKASCRGDAKSKGKGIWQYTESGLWEPETEVRMNAGSGGAEVAGDDGGALRRVLAGQTKWVVARTKVPQSDDS